MKSDRTASLVRSMLVFATVAVSLASATVTSALTTDSGTGLTVDQTAHDFGEVDPGTVLKQSFALRNQGTADVHITRLNTASAALAVELLDATGKSVMTLDATHTPYALGPGATASLLVTLDTHAAQGNIRRRVLVLSDDPGHEVLSILLSAKVRGTAAAPPAVDARSSASTQTQSEIDSGGPAPAIEISEPEVDFGKTVQGESLKRALKLKNAGKAPLKISRLATTCGCTVPRIITKAGTLTPEEINAGRAIIEADEEATLEIELNTRTLVGPVKREVSVFSNDPRKGQLVIAVKAHPEKAYELSPEVLDFGRLLHGHDATLVTRLTVKGIGACDIAAIEAPAAHVTASWKRAPSAASSDDGTTSAAFDIEVTVDAGAPLGTIMNPCVVVTTTSKLGRISLPIRAHVTPEVNFDAGDPNAPDRVDFGMIDDRHDAVREIEIKNENRAVPYRPTAIEVLGKYAEHVKTELVTIDDGVEYRLKLTIDPSLDARYFRGIVRLSSAHPDLPTKDISFQGWRIKK